MNKLLKTNFHLLLIIGFAFICFHFLWLSPYSMKWDMAEQYLPWRYFVGKSIQNGEFPFWNPFQLGGYPAYADPQSASWYYPAWIIGSTFGYSMKMLEIEFLTLIILAGIGFYYLLKKLEITNISACLFSICYMCSGFIIGNAQHITWIAAAAWMPWLVYQYLFVRKDIYNIHSIWFIIVLYFFVSGSYPAFTIVLAYILAIDQFILFVKERNKLYFILNKSLLLFACLLILTPILYSLYYSRDFFSRGDSLILSKALQNPFSWQSLLSLITPFASFKNPSLFQTDISMSNAYIGIIPLVILLISVISGNIKKNYLYLLLSILFLLIGFGAQTPIRAILYEYIPGFNLFRFPALFRLFFIISILIYAAKQFDLIDFTSIKIRWIIITSISIFILVVILNIKSWHAFDLLSLTSISKDFETTTFIQHVIFQLVLQILLLIIVLFAIIKFKSKYILLIICCLDLFISVRLNAMATMVLETKSKQVDEQIANAPKQFHTPKLNQLYQNIDQHYEYRWPLNWNMNCYFGEIAIDGYNPFVLNTFNSLSESKLKDSIWKNTWLYFPNFLVYSDTPKAINTSTAWINNSDGLKLNDTLQFQSEVNIDSIIFTSNNLILNYNSSSEAAIVFAQNPYRGWIASIDGKETSITTVNYSQQMIIAPKGTHQITWQFKDSVLTFITYLHLILLSLLILFATIKNIRNLHI